MSIKEFKITKCDGCILNGIDGDEEAECYYYRKDNSYSRQQKTDPLKMNKKPRYCKVKKITIEMGK